jgi:hypothetical protein
VLKRREGEMARATVKGGGERKKVKLGLHLRLLALNGVKLHVRVAPVKSSCAPLKVLVRFSHHNTVFMGEGRGRSRSPVSSSRGHRSYRNDERDAARGHSRDRKDTRKHSKSRSRSRSPCKYASSAQGQYSYGA